jgi:hypothetical protein
MAIDPVRLARIRARLLAASALAVPACGGGVPEHVNERPRDPVHVNEAQPDPKPVDSPINDRQNPDIAPTAPPAEKAPDAPHINRPKPDSTTSVAPTPSPKDIPPPGQTINVAHDDKTPHTINTVQQLPTPTAKPSTKTHVNTPEPFNPR